MAVEPCAMRVCFVPLDSSSPRFFGFSEFLAGLALMVLVWTISDVRYRFRIRCAPIPLQTISFIVVTAVGILTLLTDLWRAQGWLVLKVSYLTPASWQAVIAGVYFFTFLAWVVFAFIKPASFSKWNAERYARTLFQVIVKGAPSELPVIADELRYSAQKIVACATGARRHPDTQPKSSRKRQKFSKAESFANDILSLMADKRFCRAVIESSPGTAGAFFFAMEESKKYGIQIQAFAGNIVNEAIENKGSFLYHEDGGYQSGLIGRVKPISQAIFGNYQMVETIGTLLETDYRIKNKWDSSQWEAYSRVVLLTFRNYVEDGNGAHSHVLNNALKNLQEAPFELYLLDGTSNSNWNQDSISCLRVVVEFVQEAVKLLETKEITTSELKKRTRNNEKHIDRSIYDQIAQLIYGVILEAASVKCPKDLCWTVQYVSLWSRLFNYSHLDGPAGHIVKVRTCRLLYNEILKMNKYPNFEGARILRFCLNVLGFVRPKDMGDPPPLAGWQ